jgi:hypothetical protein
MQIRIECTHPDLPDNWIGLSDAWSRGEILAFYPAALQGNDEITLPILQRKLTSVHLHLVDGSLVEDAGELFERFDQLDFRLARWFLAGVMDALKEMMSLGEAQRRLLFDGVEIAARNPTTPRTR